jgi:hypothetical protein
MRKACLLALFWLLAGCGRSALDRCDQPFDSGPCDAAIRVFAYVDGSCVERIYGGCQGNDNRFGTLDDCQLACD